ncbi:MAG: helix-turn-helix domain-containing protein [Candidatus Saccharimonadales bacterium]
MYDAINIIIKRFIMITAAKIRAARALVRWSARELGERSDVGIATIQRLELDEGVPSGRAHTLLKLQQALESAGVEFIGTPDDAPGVRLVASVNARPTRK